MDEDFVYEEIIYHVESDEKNIKTTKRVKSDKKNIKTTKRVKSDETNINPTNKRPRFDYHEIKRFTDEKRFTKWIQGTDWSKVDKRGKNRSNYHCKFSKRKGYSCKAKLRVIRPPDSNLIRVEQSDGEHTHQPIVPLVGRLKLTEQAKMFIDDQLRLGKTAQEIRNAFQECYRDHLDDVPQLLQIQNFIQRQRKAAAQAQPTAEEFEAAILNEFDEDEHHHHPFFIHPKVDYVKRWHPSDFSALRTEKIAEAEGANEEEDGENGGLLHYGTAPLNHVVIDDQEEQQQEKSPLNLKRNKQKPGGHQTAKNNNTAHSYYHHLSPPRQQNQQFFNTNGNPGGTHAYDNQQQQCYQCHHHQQQSQTRDRFSYFGSFVEGAVRDMHHSQSAQHASQLIQAIYATVANYQMMQESPSASAPACHTANNNNAILISGSNNSQIIVDNNNESQCMEHV